MSPVWLIVFIRICWFLALGEFTVYQWTTSQDIPLIERFLDSSYILNDFYTNSVMGSPRLPFVYIITYLSKFNIEWMRILYFFKALYFVLSPVLIFEILRRVFSMFGVNRHKYLVNLILVVSVAFDLIGFFWGKGGNPIGWGSITSRTDFMPMTFSFLLLTVYFNIQKKSYSFLFLFLATLIHPVMGLAGAFLYILFKYTYKWNLKFDLKDALHFFLGVFLPIFIIKFIFESGSMNSKDFIVHYVYVRHPHHYSIIENFNFKTIFFGLCTLFPLYFFRQDTKLLRISIVSLVWFFASLFLQYIGVEVLRIKSIAILGPSRFSTFCASILFFQYLIIFYRVLESKTYIKILDEKVRRIFSQLNFRFLTLINVYIGVILISILLSILTFKNPIKYYKRGKFEQVSKWINKNIDKEATFYLGYKIDSFIFRSYAKRAVYADMAFPFNEKYIQEFSRRYLIYKNTKDFTWRDYQCLRTKTDVDYLIIRNVDAKSFPEAYVLYKDKKYSVYDLPKLDDCDLTKLMSDYDKFENFLFN